MSLAPLAGVSIDHMTSLRMLPTPTLAAVAWVAVYAEFFTGIMTPWLRKFRSHPARAGVDMEPTCIIRDLKLIRQSSDETSFNMANSKKSFIFCPEAFIHSSGTDGNRLTPSHTLPLEYLASPGMGVLFLITVLLFTV